MESGVVCESFRMVLVVWKDRIDKVFESWNDDWKGVDMRLECRGVESLFGD